MKIYHLILLFGVILSGCTYTNLFAPKPNVPVQAPPATLTVVISPTSTNTITPTIPTPTFTGTPTLIYLGRSPTLISTDSLIGTPGSIFSPTPTSTQTALVATVPDNGIFTTIKISADHLFWGSCEPSSVKIATHIGDLKNVHTVTVWLRLANKKTGDTTEWGGGAIMNDDGQGNYSYTLTAKSFSHYREFIEAWGQYQLVASDRSLQRVSASSQYLNSLTVAPCS
jgi:hypothetical protein